MTWLVRFREEREGGGTEIGAAPSISPGKRTIDQCTTDPRNARVPVAAAPKRVTATTLGWFGVWRIDSIGASGSTDPDWCAAQCTRDLMTAQ